MWQKYFIDFEQNPYILLGFSKYAFHFTVVEHCSQEISY